MSRNSTLVAGGVVALFVLLAVPMMFVAAAPRPSVAACRLLSVGGAAADGLPGTPNVAAADALHLTPPQFRNACIIVGVVVKKGLSKQAAVIAIAAALPESNLLNLASRKQPGSEQHPNDGVAEGDATSVGLFQQLASSYPDIDRMNPVQATEAFLRDMLAIHPDWESLPPGDVVADVQRPREDLRGKYAERVGQAQAIVDAMWDAAVAAAAFGGAVVAGTGALPLANAIYDAFPERFTAPHHDNPAVDIAVPEGTTVYAVSPGLVVSAPVGGDCGNGVSILGDDGATYTYCHGFVPLVSPGVVVAPGDPIMMSGNTGHSTGPHLHLQITLRSGVLVCPQAAMGPWSQGLGVDPASLPTSGCTY